MKAYTEQHKDATNPSTSLSTHIPWLTPITRGKQKFSPRNTDGLIIKVVPSLFPGLDLRPFGAWNKKPKYSYQMVSCFHGDASKKSPTRNKDKQGHLMSFT